MKTINEFLKQFYVTSPEDFRKINEAGEDNDTENAEIRTDDETEIRKDIDKKNKKYFFDNIIFFTNDREPSRNKTLKKLTEAIKDTDINLVVFVAEEVTYKATDDYISISDTKTKFKIDKQSNVDTIVISRLGVQNSEECMECVKELQDWGLFVLNPILPSKRASNKYQTAVLLERYKLPQPRFALLGIDDIKKGDETLNKKLKKIYPDIGKDEEADKDKEYVIKILDGHGGTGVAMVTGKMILAILQMVFAIDPERELLLQRKEEIDGGDLRIHVLTMRTEQYILAAMKRKKISKDFRSNVSLGATAEKVELTEEQKDIALKVAKVSGLPWVGVDIAPLVKGSNPEIGDNIVLEYNASAGSDGISEVIGENFMKILLDNINDINQLVLAPKSVGYIEDVTFFFNKDNEDGVKIEAKFDSGNGAKASTIGCESLNEDGDYILARIEGKEYKFKKHGQSKAIVGQVTEPRQTVIVPCIQIGSRKLLDVEFALVDNRNKKQKVLLNRDVMAKMGYVINPAKKHALDDEFQEIKEKTK
jgi:ribosomal protein S6--L-glutamate ligase